MSLNPVAAYLATDLRSSQSQGKARCAGIVVVLVLALGLGGCALNSFGLPGGLPVPPGGGTLSITRTTLVNGIQGRGYTISITTSGGTGALTSCSIIGGALPTGLSVGVDPANASRCRITGTIAASVTPGGVTFTVQAADTGTPSATASQVFLLTVRAEFAITTTGAMLDGVQGRTYGNAPQTPQPVNTSASATVGNAPLTSCTFTVTASNPGFNLTPAPAGAACPLSSGATPLSAAGNYTVRLSVVDSPIIDPVLGGTVVPAGTVTNTLAAPTLTVRAPLASALAQSTNATPNTALLPAVEFRSYGRGAQAAGAPQFTATGGIPSSTGNYGWCLFAGAIPAGFTTVPGPISTDCATPTAVASVTPLTLESTAAGAASGPTAFTLRVSDSGNAAVPAGTSTQATALTINSALSIAVNFGSLPDAVVGRPYGGAGFTAVIYTASNGLGAYTFSTPASVAAPGAAFPTPMACVAAATTFTCSSAAITAADGTYNNIPVSVNDAGNAAVPGSAAASVTATITRSLTIRKALTFASVNYGNPLPAAVNGRLWGGGVAGLTPLIYTAQDGLGGYSFAVSGTAFPTGILCVTSAATFTCDTSTTPAGVTGAPGAYNGILVNVNDTANATTPDALASATQPAAISRNLTVNAEISLTSVVPDPGNAATSAAVIGRAYGAPGGRTSPVYTFAGGLGGYTITTPTIPGWMACTPTPPTLTCDSGATTVAAGPSTITVNVVDTANAATPAKSPAFADTRTITVNADISLTSVVPDPAAATSAAVIGRQYGAPGGKTSPLYTFAGGLGGFTITTPTKPAWMTCTATPPTLTCDSGATTVAAGPSTITVNVVDTANSTTPANSPAFADTRTITVNAALAIALAQNSADLTGGAPAVLAPGVTGRTYARGAQATTGAVNYTGTGGTGSSTYRWCISAGAVPAGFVDRTLVVAVSTTCTLGGSTAAASITLEADPVTGGAATYNFTMQLGDGGNTTTPDSFAVPTSSSQDTRVVINADISLTSVAPDPGNAATSTGVIGRTYGKAPQSPPVYTFAGGIGAYTITTPTIPAWMTCTPTPPTLTCDSGATTVAAGPSTITVNVVDTANAATPAKSPAFADTRTITVNADISLTSVAPDPGNAATSTGVIGRTYGKAPQSPPVYTFVGGIGAYTITTPTIPAWMTCTPTPPTLTCDSGATTVAAGPSTITVNVVDTANTTTPAISPAFADTRTITVNAALTITTATLPNGLLGYTYAPAPPGPGGVTLAATGGIGGLTWVAGGSSGPCSPTGSPPTGLGLDASGLLSGIPTVASTLTTDFTFEVCVFDTANTTTPRGTPAVLPAYTVNIMNTFAYLADNTNDAVEVINTTTNAAVTTIALTGGDLPFGVAVTPDGRKAYVTLNGVDEVAVIDTITNSVSTTISLSTCTGPLGIAMGTPGGVSPRAFVACSNGEIAVLDTTTDTELSSTTYGSPGATLYGIAISPDDAFVAATDTANAEVIVLNSVTLVNVTNSPATAGVSAPHGVAFSANSARLYIAGAFSDDVVVVDPNDPTNVIAGPIATGGGGGVDTPEQIAVTPDGTRVYVTLNGASNGFAVFNDGATPTLNTVVTPVNFSSPFGVTIPPLLIVPATGVRVYFAQFIGASVEIHDDELTTPFGRNGASPINLSGGATPQIIAHIPVPR